jgi:hypothetical protein
VADQGDHVNRNRLFAGGSIAVLLILIITGLILLRAELQSRQTQVNQREPLQGLAYCDSQQITPCIVSFSRDSQGRMLINILADRSFPDFYLKIIHSDGESIYPCREVERFSTSVYCTGKILPLGEIFQFYILSVDDNSLLAQGNFSIIGIALASVDTFVSTAGPTPSAVSSAVSVTAGTPTITLTPGRGTPTRTPTPTRTASYPNYP